MIKEVEMSLARPLARLLTWARNAGNLLVSLALCVPYALGWLVGAIVLTGWTVGTAAQLGWSDARKRGDRGAD